MSLGLYANDYANSNALLKGGRFRSLTYKVGSEIQLSELCPA